MKYLPSASSYRMLKLRQHQVHPAVHEEKEPSSNIKQAFIHLSDNSTFNTEFFFRFLVFCCLVYWLNHLPEYLDHEVYYLHGTDEREASEEPHGSSYS